MNGEQHILSLWIAIVAGFLPFTAAYKTAMRHYGADEVPLGCLLVIGLPLLAGPFIAYWFYQTFAVVARP